jgi:hypothetical protein
VTGATPPRACGPEGGTKPDVPPRERGRGLASPKGAMAEGGTPLGARESLCGGAPRGERGRDREGRGRGAAAGLVGPSHPTAKRESVEVGKRESVEAGDAEYKACQGASHACLLMIMAGSLSWQGAPAPPNAPCAPSSLPRCAPPLRGGRPRRSASRRAARRGGSCARRRPAWRDPAPASL